MWPGVKTSQIRQTWMQYRNRIDWRHDEGCWAPRCRCRRRGKVKTACSSLRTCYKGMGCVRKSGCTNVGQDAILPYLPPMLDAPKGMGGACNSMRAVLSYVNDLVVPKCWIEDSYRAIAGNPGWPTCISAQRVWHLPTLSGFPRFNGHRGVRTWACELRKEQDVDDAQVTTAGRPASF